MQLVLLPCSNSAGRNNFAKTVENRIPLVELLPYLTEDEARDARAVLPEMVAVWGATPASDGGNATRWRQMDTGDIALFYRDGSFFARGEVAFKTRNVALARHLWGEKSPGETWEYVHVLTNLTPVTIDIEAFNQAAGRSLHRLSQPILRFDVLDSERSEDVMATFELEYSTTATVASAGDLAEAERRLASLPDDLNRKRLGTARVEQGLLRKILLSNKREEACSICGETLPVDLLVIGHILKRSASSPQQKKDRANVMPVCLLGCDSLFEKGYLYVDSSGLVRVSESTPQAAAVAARATELASKPCSAWSSKSEPYFQKHRLAIGKG